MSDRDLKVGDDVRIGNGRKVYRVSAVARGGYLLAASSDHPNSAQRVQDALRVYTSNELTKVARERCPNFVLVTDTHGARCAGAKGHQGGCW